MKQYLWIITLGLVMSGCRKEGCTNYIAENFDKRARVDDGSCVVKGCTDPTSITYNKDATIDDGTCDSGSNGAIIIWSESDSPFDLYVYVDGSFIGDLSWNYTDSDNWYSGKPDCNTSSYVIRLTGYSEGLHSWSTGTGSGTFYLFTSTSCTTVKIE